MAYEESNTIVVDAKKNASRIINEALLKAENIENETFNIRKIKEEEEWI